MSSILSFVERTREADRDIVSLYQASAKRFGIRQADRYAEDLGRCFERLAGMPTMARVQVVNGREYRRHEHGRHSIFFRVTDRGILIVRVLHARMDPAQRL